MRFSPSTVVTLASLVLLAGPAVCTAQGPTRWYGGGLIGTSTLSADAQAITSPVGFAVSLYAPENGLAANLFVGNHLNDYLTLQANYIWIRNGLTLVSTRAAASGIVRFANTAARDSLVVATTSLEPSFTDSHSSADKAGGTPSGASKQ